MIESYFWHNQKGHEYHYTQVLKEVDEILLEVKEFTLYGDAIYESDTTYPTNAIKKQKKMKIENLNFFKAIIDNLFETDKFKYIYIYDTDNAVGLITETIYER